MGSLTPRAARAWLAAERARAPATDANVARNGRAAPARRTRWGSARDALWQLLDPLVAAGARVGIVGAGNGHDLPLRRIAARAGRVVLLDLDAGAAEGARKRVRRAQRDRVEVLEHDVTGGAADAIVRAAHLGRPARTVHAPGEDLPGAPYDVVVGDLLYSQLLYPALLDLEVPDARLRATLTTHGPALTRSVVARLQRSAPQGVVVHVHDPVGWWAGHTQPVTLPAILEAAQEDVGAALTLAARCQGPREADPRTALTALGVPIRTTALWRWPFAEAVDYLACATVAGRPSADDDDRDQGQGPGQHGEQRQRLQGAAAVPALVRPDDLPPPGGEGERGAEDEERPGGGHAEDVVAAVDGVLGDREPRGGHEQEGALPGERGADAGETRPGREGH